MKSDRGRHGSTNAGRALAGLTLGLLLALAVGLGLRQMTATAAESRPSAVPAMAGTAEERPVQQPDQPAAGANRAVRHLPAPGAEERMTESHGCPGCAPGRAGLAADQEERTPS